MGILDLFYMDIIAAEQTLEDYRGSLVKAKSHSRRSQCIHEFHFEKWVHNGAKQGKTYHYKECCDKCGMKRCIPRTKELYEILKNERWHYKTKK